jgi:hypothetical protein
LAEEIYLRGTDAPVRLTGAVEEGPNVQKHKGVKITDKDACRKMALYRDCMDNQLIGIWAERDRL